MHEWGTDQHARWRAPGQGPLAGAGPPGHRPGPDQDPPHLAANREVREKLGIDIEVTPRDHRNTDWEHQATGRDRRNRETHTFMPEPRDPDSLVIVPDRREVKHWFWADPAELATLMSPGGYQCYLDAVGGVRFTCLTEPARPRPTSRHWLDHLLTL